MGLAAVSWLADDSCPMQAIYLLEISSMAMQRVRPPNEMLSVQSNVFSADNALIVIASQTPYPHYKSKIEVLERNGHQSSCFSDPMCNGAPLLAMLTGSRAAIAHSEDFSVWDLCTGRLLSNTRPAIPAHAHPLLGIKHDAIVIAGAGGAKLAFRARNSSDMLLYDASTLCMLGCVSSFQHSGSWFPDETLVWGAFNWVIWKQQLKPYCRAAALSIVKPIMHQASRSLSLHSVMDMRVSYCMYALSPDGALICMVIQDDEGLAIIDTRTGQVAAIIACNEHVYHVSWSSCGRWIIVGTTWRTGPTFRSPEQFTDRLSIVIL